MPDVDYVLDEMRDSGEVLCASCRRPRWVTDMARMYVHDDYFLLCHGVNDESPTCYESYQAGRERFAAEKKASTA